MIGLRAPDDNHDSFDQPSGPLWFEWLIIGATLGVGATLIIGAVVVVVYFGERL